MNKEAFKDTLKYGKCLNCTNPGTPDHVCPFKADIHDDSKSKCNCCEACTTECADDI